MKTQIAIPASWKVFWILIAIAITSLIFSEFIDTQRSSRQHNFQQQIKNGGATPTATPKQLPSPSKSLATSHQSNATFPSTTIPPPTATYFITQLPTSTTSPTATLTPIPQITQLHVDVFITDSSEFSLDIPEGSNQCNVLNHALSQGKISSLLMKYHDALKSYGIYQINGKGNENQVWWVYEVNSRQVPMGCSHVKVTNNDIVRWKYVGP